MSADSDRPCFHFLSEEKRVVDALIQTVRRLLVRPDMAPKQIHQCGIVLHALERLPLVTPGIGMSLSIIQPNHSGRFWMCVTVDEERFELDKGETVYSDCGSDNESQVVFSVYPYGRDSENRHGNVSGWVDMFQWMSAAEGAEVTLDDFGSSEPDWDVSGDPELWNQLPTTPDGEG